MPRPYPKGETPWLQLSSPSATRRSVLALGACLGLGPATAFGEQAPPAAPSLEELRQLFAEQKQLLEEQGREIADLRRKAGRDEHPRPRGTQRAGRAAREAARGVGAGGRRGAPGPDGAGRPPLPGARGADGDRGRVPGIDAHPGQRRGGADRWARAHDFDQQLRPHRHGRQVRRLLDPRRGKRCRTPRATARPTRPRRANTTSICARRRGSARCVRSSRAISPAPAPATCSGFVTRTASGASSRSVRPGRRSPTPRPSPTGSTSKG